MRKILFSVAMAAMLIIISCGSDDDAKMADMLVAVERSTGKVHSINLSTGEKTEILTITGVASIRSFEYDPVTKKALVGQSYIGSETAQPYGSRVFSVDLSDGSSELIFNNLLDGTGRFYGILDLHYDNDKMFVSGYNRSNSNHSYFTINTSSGAIGEITDTETDYPLGGAIYVDEKAEILYYTEWQTGNSGLRVVDMTDGTETKTDWSTTNAAAFEAIDADFDINEVAVQNFAVNSKGEVYASVAAQTGGNSSREEGNPSEFWFLAKVNLEDATLEYVATLANSRSAQIQAIGFVPKNSIE